MSYTYPEWVEAIAALLQYTEQLVDPTLASPTDDPRINAALPRAIEYAEQRIYRELDLVGASAADPNGVFTPNNRVMTLPSANGKFVVVERVAALVGGVRQPAMLPVSQDFLDSAWPSDTAPSAASVPLYWNRFSEDEIIVGPAPGSALGAEIFGTVRPAPLSASNTTTLLTSLLPDLFFAATVVWMTGFQRAWSEQADDPKLALSWSNTYDVLSKSAGMEELRKSFSADAWTARSPNPIAKPPQT